MPQDWSLPWTLNAQIQHVNVNDSGIQFDLEAGDENGAYASARMSLNPGDVSLGHGSLILNGPTINNSVDITGIDWTIPHTLTLLWDGAGYSALWDGAHQINLSDSLPDPTQAVSYGMHTGTSLDSWILHSMSATTP